MINRNIGVYEKWIPLSFLVEEKEQQFILRVWRDASCSGEDIPPGWQATYSVSNDSLWLVSVNWQQVEPQS